MISHATTGATILALAYTYDANGNRTSGDDQRQGAPRAGTLDALNRLTGVAHSGGGATTYTYDANGNRLTKTTGAGTATYTHNAGERLTSDGVSTYSYDADGNLTARGADTFAYDYAGRMTGATVAGATSTYAYDGDDTRVSVTTGGTPIPQLWDRVCGGTKCGGSCGGGGRTTVPMMVDDTASTYLWADGLAAEVASGGTRLEDLNDGLGSVRSWTDAGASVTASANYDAFGGLAASNGTPGQFRFTGEQWDAATGFEFLRARYYDSAVGRFTASDTVQPNAEGTQGWNLYAYVANNPTTWVDLTGRLRPATPESFALYAVQVAAKAGLVGLGIAIADNLKLLALLLQGAWALIDFMKVLVQPEPEACVGEYEDCMDDCKLWRLGTRGPCVRACGEALAECRRKLWLGNRRLIQTPR
ncbi:RHS repeat-associated core domain-containing protein [Candidatus Amarobacter glycogenicus]|uniref:RHS repeat-associated core domain-containing protein n=1 Tax=Candidatus Amarobacter glycogenicus TaxID=3140699 RepID=UPI00313468D0|nr:RHS repeat-associated core domain-containing protein [Dehalococcoidia bacterium]